MQRLAGGGQHLEQPDRGQQPIAGTRPVEEDHVTRLFSPEEGLPFEHRPQDVPVTDLGFDQFDPRSAHRLSKAQIGHHGRDDHIASQPALGLEMGRNHGHHDVTVGGLTPFVHRDQPICVTIE